MNKLSLLLIPLILSLIFLNCYCQEQAEQHPERLYDNVAKLLADAVLKSLSFSSSPTPSFTAQPSSSPPGTQSQRKLENAALTITNFFYSMRSFMRKSYDATRRSLGLYNKTQSPSIYQIDELLQSLHSVHNSFIYSVLQQQHQNKPSVFRSVLFFMHRRRDPLYRRLFHSAKNYNHHQLFNRFISRLDVAVNLVQSNLNESVSSDCLEPLKNFITTAKTLNTQQLYHEPPPSALLGHAPKILPLVILESPRKYVQSKAKQYMYTLSNVCQSSLLYFKPDSKLHDTSVPWTIQSCILVHMRLLFDFVSVVSSKMLTKVLAAYLSSIVAFLEISVELITKLNNLLSTIFENIQTFTRSNFQKLSFRYAELPQTLGKLDMSKWISVPLRSSSRTFKTKWLFKNILALCSLPFKIVQMLGRFVYNLFQRIVFIRVPKLIRTIRSKHQCLFTPDATALHEGDGENGPFVSGLEDDVVVMKDKRAQLWNQFSVLLHEAIDVYGNMGLEFFDNLFILLVAVPICFATVFLSIHLVSTVKKGCSACVLFLGSVITRFARGFLKVVTWPWNETKELPKERKESNPESDSKRAAEDMGERPDTRNRKGQSTGPSELPNRDEREGREESHDNRESIRVGNGRQLQSAATENIQTAEPPITLNEERSGSLPRNIAGIAPRRINVRVEPTSKIQPEAARLGPGGLPPFMRHRPIQESPVANLRDMVPVTRTNGPRMSSLSNDDWFDAESNTPLGAATDNENENMEDFGEEEEDSDNFSSSSSPILRHQNSTRAAQNNKDGTESEDSSVVYVSTMLRRRRPEGRPKGMNKLGNASPEVEYALSMLDENRRRQRNTLKKLDGSKESKIPRAKRLRAEGCTAAIEARPENDHQ